MNAQFILLAQSATAAVIEIILLLSGAALIGFLTAWYYQKNHYVPIVNKLESEKADLISQVNSLKTDLEKLKERIKGLENNLLDRDKAIVELKKEITDLKVKK